MRIAVKTNAVSWATLSPNIGLSFCLDNNSVIDVDLSFNAWRIPNYSFPHAKLSLEYKYYFAAALSQHYLGANVMAGMYDINAGKLSFKEDMLSVGLTYGYSFLLSPHWNLEPSLGLGYAYVNKYEDTGSKACHRAMLNKIGISIIYIIK